MNSNQCAVTSAVRGALINGKPVILDTHHLENRITCPALRYNALNGIALSKSAHKFGRNSAHKGPIWFGKWLADNRPGQLQYILDHRDDPIDLDDRNTLYGIEAELKNPPTRFELLLIGVDPDTFNAKQQGVQVDAGNQDSNAK